MTFFSTFSILIVLAAAFAYVNYRFIKLPSAIGLMLLAIITSLSVVGIGIIHPATLTTVTGFLNTFDFPELLLGSMLSFMLFAGAIHIRLDELKRERLSVIVFSTISVVLSTFIIGMAMYVLLPVFGVKQDLIYCLLFGALISPTDPIAVLGILKDAKVSKSLEMKIAGESLFNDGVAVVVFLTIIQVADHPENFRFSDIVVLFIREALGGIVFGLLIGYIGFYLMRSIDNYKVEVLITLAVVMGGYTLADALHISGPLAMVAAGIIIGNQGKKFAMSSITAEYIDMFWELIDDLLNAILFVLIGMELLVLHFSWNFLFVGIATIVIVLITRYLSVFLPAQIIRMQEKITQRTLVILTWGGLRGGISIALALSLKANMGKDLWVTLTYFVVAFAIIVQGLTIGKVAKRLKEPSTTAPPAPFNK